MITKIDITELRKKFSALSWLRALLGIVILASILIWVINQGTLLKRLSVWVLLSSTILSLLTNLIQASTLSIIARVYNRHLNFRHALYVTAIGSLGNAAGGLPVGTTLKFFVLHKHAGLRIKQITFGLICFTIGVSIALLGFASVSIFALDFPLLVKSIPITIFVSAVIALFVTLRWLHGKAQVPTLVKPFLLIQHVTTVGVLSFSLAAMFVLNSSMVGRFIQPENSLIQIIFFSSSGILLGLGSFLHAVGGVQELSMGFFAFLAGAKTIDGVQLALVLRIASMISSGIILAISVSLPNVSPIATKN